MNSFNDKKSPDGGLTVPYMNDAARRSFEDEERPLPEGWIRQWDPNTQHHFYVDTRANPPRSIWDHPLEDREYLKSAGHEHDLSDSDSSDGERDKKQIQSSGTRNISGPGAQDRSGPGAQRNQGIIGSFIDRIIGNGPEQRYYDRRQVLQQNNGYVPQNMAGPMYPVAGAPLYAAPMYPYCRRRERRWERRTRRDARRAAKRGYPVLVPVGPQAGYQGPLFNYAGPSAGPSGYGRPY